MGPCQLERRYDKRILRRHLQDDNVVAELSTEIWMTLFGEKDSVHFDTCHHGSYHRQTLYERARCRPMGDTERKNPF